MNLFRNILFWLALAVVGALAAQLLLQDPGYVLVRYGGQDYTTTVTSGALILLAVVFGLWVLWTLLALPFRAWRGMRRRQSRARLSEGLTALHQGHWARSEKLLAQAADDQQAEAVARIAAARAADARGDAAAAQSQLDALGERHPASRAIAVAERALAHQQPIDALAALDAPAAQPLPPRGLSLRAEALAASGQAGQAYGLLGPMRQQNALSGERLDHLQTHWAEASLRQAGDANVLAERWETLPKAAKSEPAVVAAYAERAAALRWDEAAAKSLEQALDARWADSLADLYGRLSIGRVDARRANAERWLQTHPSSPALLVTLARLARAQGQWPQAEEYLHRALAQGAGSEAWEELGHGFAAAGDDSRARLSYANALRASRNEPVQEFTGRDLRQKIFDQAAVEERNEHGMPRLRE